MSKQLSKKKAYTFVAFMVVFLGICTIENHAQAQNYGYGSGYDQGTYEKSSLQYCNGSYERHGISRMRFRRYTGYCYTEFNSYNEPIYVYHQYQICRKTHRSYGHGIRHYRKKCQGPYSYAYERDIHPLNPYRNWRYGYGKRYHDGSSPPHQRGGHQEGTHPRQGELDREHRHRYND